MSVKFVLILSVAFAAHAFAQESHYRIGASWLLLQHARSVQTAAATGECGTFADGTGVGGAFSGGVDFPMASNLRLGGRLSLGLGTMHFVTRMSDLLVRDANYALVPFVRDYTLSGELAQISAVCEASMRVPLIPLWLSVGVGPELRIVLQPNRSGQIISPDNVLFENQQRSEDLGPATLSGVRPLGGVATIAAAFELPVSRTLRLMPEVRASYSFPAITTSGTWKPLTVSFGVSMSGPLHDEPLPEPVVVTTIIRTGGTVAPEAPPDQNADLFAAYEVIDSTPLSRPARIAMARATLHIVHIERDREYSRDSVIDVLSPHDIAFRIVAGQPRRTMGWSVVVQASEDSLFQLSSGMSAAPPAILWHDEEIRTAMFDVIHPVQAKVMLRDTAGHWRMIGTQNIPVVLDPTISGGRVTRYEMRAAVFADRVDSLLRVIGHKSDWVAGALKRVTVSTSGYNNAAVNLMTQELDRRGIYFRVRRNVPVEDEVVVDVWER